MFSIQQPHVYRSQHQNTKPRALFLNTVNQRVLFFILVGSHVPALESSHVHFHRWTTRRDGDGAEGEQEKAKFLQTDCFSIRKHGLSSKTHWIQIMRRGDFILLWYAVWLDSTMEKIGEGIKRQCGVLCKSVENSWKNGGAWAEMGPVRLIESLCVSRNLYHFFLLISSFCNDACALVIKAAVDHASGFEHNACLFV